MATGASKGYAVKIKGLPELEKAFKVAPELTNRELNLALQKSTKALVRNIKPHAPHFRGHLRRSIKGEVKGSGINLIGVVGAMLKNAIYPLVMEYGRKRNKRQPPYQTLIPWVRRKWSVDNKSAKRAAYNLAVKIRRKGIKKHLYMKKGYKETTRQINKYFGLALRRINKGLSAT